MAERDPISGHHDTLERSLGEEAARKIIGAHPKLFNTAKFEDKGLSERSKPLWDLPWVPVGWKDLVTGLCDDLEGMVPQDSPEGFGVVQIKSKFGGLRFYIKQGQTEIKGIDERIQLAHEESYRTCEQCGRPGELLETDEYLYTSCPDHAAPTNKKVFRKLQ
jgi:hypothetical protein